MAAPEKKKQYTQVDALWEVGMFKRYDVIVFFLFLFSWFVIGAWLVFGQPDLIKVVLASVLTLILLMLWIISLIYRTIWFIVKQWADIKLLPAQAAKLAVAFTQGSAPPPQQ
jgi:hypothetical protein